MTENWTPIYDRGGWHSCPRHKLFWTFADGLIDKDKKVAFAKNVLN